MPTSTSTVFPFIRCTRRDMPASGALRARGRSSRAKTNAQAAGGGRKTPAKNAGFILPRTVLSGIPRGFTIWLTGLSGSGKTTNALLLERRLRDSGARVEVLDGDTVRSHLSRDLGFSKKDRDENIRRIGYVCEILSRNGVVAIAAAISPYRAERERVRSRIPDFVEVYVECPLDVLIRRDPKGL